MMIVGLVIDIVLAPSLVPVLMWSAVTGGMPGFAAAVGLVLALLVLVVLRYRFAHHTPRKLP